MRTGAVLGVSGRPGGGRAGAAMVVGAGDTVEGLVDAARAAKSGYMASGDRSDI